MSVELIETPATTEKLELVKDGVVVATAKPLQGVTDVWQIDLRPGSEAVTLPPVRGERARRILDRIREMMYSIPQTLADEDAFVEAPIGIRWHCAYNDGVYVRVEDGFDFYKSKSDDEPALKSHPMERMSRYAFPLVRVTE